MHRYPSYFGRQTSLMACPSAANREQFQSDTDLSGDERAAGVLLLAGAFANFAEAIMFSIRGGPSEMADELFPSWGSGVLVLLTR
jgi:hypothetical protein